MPTTSVAAGAGRTRRRSAWACSPATSWSASRGSPSRTSQKLRKHDRDARRRSRCACAGRAPCARSGPRRRARSATSACSASSSTCTATARCTSARCARPISPEQELWLVTKGTGERSCATSSCAGDRSNVQGVVGIVREQSTAVGQGLYLEQLAWLSLSLALFNLLPFLPLDGGHILFALIERLRRKPLSREIYERVSLVGISVFVLLFLFVLQQDVGPHPGRRAPGAVARRRILTVGGKRASDRGRRHSDRGRCPGQRPVDDDDEDARRRGDARAGRAPARGRRRHRARGRARASPTPTRCRRSSRARGCRSSPTSTSTPRSRCAPWTRASPPCASTPATSAGPTRSRRSCARRRPPATPLRIGANSGSLPDHLRPLATADPAGALVAAAMEEVELLERLGFRDFKISVKSSSVPDDDRGLPPAGRRGALPAAPGRDRGRAARRRHRQVGDRHRHAAGRRHRRHDPRLAHGRSGRGGRRRRSRSSRRSGCASRART